MNVLHLGTYPIKKPRHGGQLRVSNILKSYIASGIQSFYVAIYEEEHYTKDDVGELDIPFPTTASVRKGHHPYVADYLSGEFAIHDEVVCETLLKTFLKIKPDVIQLEQPWLWKWVKNLLRYTGKLNVVYSGQNVDFILKKQIISTEVNSDYVREILLSIEELETELCQYADIVIATTQADADVYRKMGAKKVIVARNGTAIRPINSTVLNDWRYVIDYPFALFVGSAYPPNAEGFCEMIYPSAGFLPPNQRIIVVGGVADILSQQPQFQKWVLINQDRIIMLGQQSDDVLSALIELCSCLILPITKGGGSNIKTAEAVYSGKPVIATSKSLRGYEFVKAFENVFIADDSTLFCKLIKDVLDGKKNISCNLKKNTLLWKHTLRELPGEIRQLNTTSLQFSPRNFRDYFSDYESMIQVVYESILESDDVALDIGCRTGRHLMPLARRISRKGKVIGFEPLPHCREYLANVFTSDTSIATQGIAIYPYALGDVDGTTVYVYVENLPEYSGLRERSVYGSEVIKKTINVEVRQGDNILDLDRLNFVKVDCEGGEYHALLGCQKLISKHKPLICFEYGAASFATYDLGDGAPIWDFLVGQLDYVIFDINLKQLTRKEFLSSIQTQNLWDYVACPSDKLYLMATIHYGYLINVYKYNPLCTDELFPLVNNRDCFFEIESSKKIIDILLDFYCYQKLVVAPHLA